MRPKGESLQKSIYFEFLSWVEKFPFAVITKKEDQINEKKERSSRFVFRLVFLLRFFCVFRLTSYVR